MNTKLVKERKEDLKGLRVHRKVIGSMEEKSQWDFRIVDLGD